MRISEFSVVFVGVLVLVVGQVFMVYPNRVLMWLHILGIWAYLLVMFVFIWAYIRFKTKKLEAPPYPDTKKDLKPLKTKEKGFQNDYLGVDTQIMEVSKINDDLED